MNKTILITGSTDGIGKLAAIKLAKEGHQVFIHGRNAQKLSKVISAIKTESGNDRIKGFTADFSDLNAVKELAEQINNELPQLDILINNAGVFKSPSVHNDAGLDMRYVVNYFAPYVLTNALLPLLKKSTEGRIINLSSAAQDPINYDTLKGAISQSDRTTYGQSKLALTMWSFHLASTLQNVTVTAVNPGSLLNTNMVKEAFGQFWSSADKGANILYDLAISEEYKDITGQYFDNDKGDKKGTFGKAHADAYDSFEIKKLMKATSDILNG